jgi:PAS domain S-box-containing protein
MEEMEKGLEKFVAVEKFLNELIEFHDQIKKLKASETYYKKLSEASQENEKNYRIMLNNLPASIFVKDKNSQYIFCNGNFAEGFKIRPEQVIGKNDFDFFPAELAQRMADTDKKIVEEGLRDESEEKISWGGKEITAGFIRAPIRNDSGEIEGALGIFWDISEKKEKEEEFNRRLTELDDLVKYRENELNAKTGEYKKELAAKEALKGQYEDLENKFQILLENSRTEKKAREEEFNEKLLELEHLLKNLENELKIKNEEYQREFAEKEALKGKMRELENSFHFLLENSESAIVELQGKKIVSVMNGGFGKITGYSKVEVEGQKSLGDFFEGEDFEKVDRILSSPEVNFSASGRQVLNLFDKEGNKKAISLAIHPTGGREKSVIFLKDVTKEKQTESQLRHTITQFRELMNEMEETLRVNSLS